MSDRVEPTIDQFKAALDEWHNIEKDLHLTWEARNPVQGESTPKVIAYRLVEAALNAEPDNYNLQQFTRGQIAFWKGEPIDVHASKQWRMGYAMERDLTTQDGPRPEPGGDTDE